MKQIGTPGGTNETQYPEIQKNADFADAELVQHAKAGEWAAFDALTTKYERRVYALAARILWNEHDAEVAAQEAFLNAIERLGDCLAADEFAPWLMGIATHSILKRVPRLESFRGTAREKSKAGTTPFNPASSEPPGMAPPPCAKPRQKSGSSMLNEVVSRMDERLRVVFLLHELEGLSTRRIAEFLALTEAQVRTRLSRAERSVWDCLQRSAVDERVHPKSRIRLSKW